MKAIKSHSLVLGAALLATVGVARSVQPPNVVVSDGNGNTAMGTLALKNLTVGQTNTAAGYSALGSNTVGSGNTAMGDAALSANTSGADNSALGLLALAHNENGGQNTASGARALRDNDTGFSNTATGADALGSNRTGSYNTSAGVASMYYNTLGIRNAATGFAALYRNTTGSNNTADGVEALYSNTTGLSNTAVGQAALFNNDSGYRNVALGFQAGFAVTGSDNITIGTFTQGKAAENGVIRIGTKSYQSKAFIAGISGVKTGLATAKTVFIDANGQLGTIKSSRIYKEDIHPMGDVSARLLSLQPVTFRYKETYDDGSRPIEFGLIAEDVAEVFPELVVNDSDGKPETVRYDLIATLLLNEFEKEHAIVQAQSERIAELEKETQELARLRQDFAKMAETLERLDHSATIAASR